MSFRVEWLESAENQLASAWVGADSGLRQAITTAAHRVESDLSTDPEHAGESRDEGERIHFIPPLAVTFEVDPGQQVVTVLSVRVFKRRG